MNDTPDHTHAHEGPRLPVPESVIARDVRALLLVLLMWPPEAQPERGVPIQAVPSGRSPRVIIRQAFAQEAKLRQRMVTHLAAGKTKAARTAQRHYLHSLQAKIVAVRAACEDLRRKGKPAPAGLDVIEVAKKVNAFHHPDEQVTIYRKKKSGRGLYRTIHEFGIINRARQKLVLAAWKPFAKLDPRQFMTTKGRQAACQRVLDLLPDYTWVMEIDIREFYPSIDRDCLRQLVPLDGRVTSSTLLLEGAEKTPKTGTQPDGSDRSILYPDGHGPKSLSQDSQRGCPQGASTSPLAGDTVIAEIMRELPPELPVVNYGDNFLIMGRARADVEEARELLEAAVMRRHVGAVTLVTKQTRRCADGFDFLGYTFKKGRSTTVLPTRKNVHKLMWSVARPLRRFNHGRDDLDQTKAKLRPRIASWRAAFGLCRNMEFFVFVLLRDLFLAVPGGDALRADLIVKRRLPLCV